METRIGVSRERHRPRQGGEFSTTASLKKTTDPSYRTTEHDTDREMIHNFFGRPLEYFGYQKEVTKTRDYHAMKKAAGVVLPKFPLRPSVVLEPLINHRQDHATQAIDDKTQKNQPIDLRGFDVQFNERSVNIDRKGQVGQKLHQIIRHDAIILKV
ncbi:MAG: hypothetical protein AUJ82_07370 [Verrucomicrobia bacterium CG1_02_43_26]|nr:MAG: hypothetical protein AUJ82_07370 [Verrucomicrobia bacterium CG1_02_43_26]